MKVNEKSWKSILTSQKEKMDRESVGNEKMYNAIETAMDIYIPKLKPFVHTEENHGATDSSFVSIDVLVSKVIRILDDDDVTLVDVRNSILTYVDIHELLRITISHQEITTVVLHPHQKTSEDNQWFTSLLPNQQTLFQKLNQIISLEPEPRESVKSNAFTGI